jgi:DNA-binding transcriptional regulator/RsmH inhibitor MraZ
VLPPVLREWAHIRKDVTSIGTLTRVEVWAKDRYVSVASAAAGTTDFRSELGLY